MADILLFKVEDRRGGVLLEHVIEVIRAVTITPLPAAPRVVEGIINIRGAVVPVFDLDARFGRSGSELTITDRFIIVRSLGRTVALRVHEASEIVSVDNTEIEAATERDSGPIAGVAKLSDGLALIYDIDLFLTATESKELDLALAESGF